MPTRALRRPLLAAASLLVWASAPLMAQQSSLSLSETTYLTPAQLVRMDLFVKGQATDGLGVVGSAQFRNESQTDYCAKIVIATFDPDDNITSLGVTPPVCVSAGMGIPTVRTLRVETTLKRVDAPLIKPPVKMRAKAIADRTFELTPESAKRLLLTRYDERQQLQRRP